MNRHSRRNRNLVLIILFSLAAVVVAPWPGMRTLDWSGVFGGDGLEADIFWKLRLPRVAVGMLAGCCLALAGTAFQALFRNPLADPFILGVSSGSSAGVALALWLGGGAVLGGHVPLDNLLAFVGALAAIAAVAFVARLRGTGDAASVLLAGVAVNFFFSSLVMLLQHLAAPSDAARMFRAMIGGIATAGWRQPLLALPFAVPGVLVVILHRRELDILSLGLEEALSRGVDVVRVRRRLFLGVSLMIGGITALCGPIGFVGLMAPHICRILVGPGHGRLAAASAAFGGAFLVLADLAARLVVRPAELPVGVVCALCGAPFFAWLLFRHSTPK